MTTDNHDQALEARARELLATELDAALMPGMAERVRKGLHDGEASIRAIVAALREGQKAGGQEAVAARFLPAGTEFLGDGLGGKTLANCFEISYQGKRYYFELSKGNNRNRYTTPQPPPGHALVPVEPTEAMARVFRADIGSATQFTHTTVQCADFASRYRAMLAAITPTKCTIQHIEPEK